MALPRTPEALQAIEQAVIQQHGDIHLAARQLAFNPLDLHQWMASDPEVNQTIANAQRLGWSALESEAIRRATGYEEDVWFQGELVGQKKVYSDGLLLALLKARVPGHQQDSTPGSRVAVQVNVMPRALTYEEWKGQRHGQLTYDENPIVEAEFKEVASNGLPDWL